jgi:hypothetical protein
MAGRGELCASRAFWVVCFRHERTDADNEALLERVNATGESFISHTVRANRLGRTFRRSGAGREQAVEAADELALEGAERTGGCGSG